MRRKVLAGLTIAMLAACGVTEAARQATTAPTIAPAERPSIRDRMAAAAGPGGAARKPAQDAEWTQAAMAALQSEGVTLLSAVPADMMQFCPGYARQSRENRAAFWAGLVSAVAAGGDGGRQQGGGRLPLVEISLPLAQASGCGASLADVQDNARCAVRIMAQAVARDGAIAGRSDAAGAGWTGLARSWLSLRSDRKRGEIAGWTRRQSYCR